MAGVVTQQAAKARVADDAPFRSVLVRARLDQTASQALVVALFMIVSQELSER